MEKQTCITGALKPDAIEHLEELGCAVSVYPHATLVTYPTGTKRQPHATKVGHHRVMLPNGIELREIATETGKCELYGFHHKIVENVY